MKINPASWGVVTANEMRRKIGLPDIGKTIMEKAEESFPIKQKENEERRKREVDDEIAPHDNDQRPNC